MKGKILAFVYFKKMFSILFIVFTLIVKLSFGFTFVSCF